MKVYLTEGGGAPSWIPSRFVSRVEAFCRASRLILPCRHCLLLLRCAAESMSSSGLLTGAIVLTLLADAAECFFFSPIQFISVWKWWKRFSSGNKTMSILVNVKRPLCPYWYFTSEPFLQTQPSVWRADINKDEHHVSVSCSCTAISRAQPHIQPSFKSIKYRFKFRLIRKKTLKQTPTGWEW